GNPVRARDEWLAFGSMPWAWRFTPPTERATLPVFELLLNRQARLTVRAFAADGKEFPFPPELRSDRVRFTDMFVRWQDPAARQRVVTRRCIPIVRVRRPQTAFLPISERPDRLFELGTTGLLHYPRDHRTRSGV